MKSSEMALKFNEKIYTPNEIDDFITKHRTLQVIKYQNVEYYNFPVSLDIETSSFECGDEKQSLMYIWMIGFNDAIMIGRTWQELINVLYRICERMLLSTTKRLIIYVHNLSYEFQFMKKYFPWKKIFSMDKYKPLKAVCNAGLEFRCSYLLSGLSLKKVAEELVYHKIEKLVGNLNYEQIRTPITPLTQEEIDYCVNDVKIVNAFIQEQINQNKGKITNIPLTKTGYVRNFCRNKCFYLEGKLHHSKEETKKYKKYRELMNMLTLSTEDEGFDEYTQLKRAFAGGFTHANSMYSNSDVICRDVASFDFTSSYPSVMIAERFPMSKGKIVKINSKKDFYKYISLYCCCFDIVFENIRPKVYYENYISKSKCFYIYGESKEEQEEIEKTKKFEHIPKYNNGRVCRAKVLSTTITDVDFEVIKELYEWEDFYVDNFIIYRRGYLPKDLIECVLSLYKDKTELKGVPEKADIYLVVKGMLNAIYGMMVTDILRPDILLDMEGEWIEKDVDITTAVKKYNTSKRRFISYPWGVWITAYARRNLFTAIIECEDDYIYSDTDSVKIFNYKNHLDYFNKYNEEMIKKLEKALEFHGIDKNAIRPKNKYGEEKILGIWDYEGTYDIFKTLGAKRYMYYREFLDDNKKKKAEEWTTDETDDVVDNKSFVITVAGLNKVKGSRHLWLNHGVNAFDVFNQDFEVSEDYTGKLTHTYLDKEMKGIVVDYLGNEYEYHELSGVHLSKQAYSLKLTDEYLKLLEKGMELYIYGEG